MTWSKLDDRFHEHPKILGLGADEFRLYVCSITYSSAHGTDGFIATVAAVTLCAQQRVRRSAIRGLVAAGCWEEDGAKGYRIHDYGDYQPTGRRTQELSEIRRKAGLAGAKKRWQTPTEPGPQSMANEMRSDGKPDGKLPMAKHAPVPDPYPYPSLKGRLVTPPNTPDKANRSGFAGAPEATEARVLTAWMEAVAKRGWLAKDTPRRRRVIHEAREAGYTEAELITHVTAGRADLEWLLRPRRLAEFRAKEQRRQAAADNGQVEA
jgi:hypothetical protein